MIVDRIISARLKTPKDSLEGAFLSELLVSEQLRLKVLSVLFALAALWIFFSPDILSIRFPLEGEYGGIPFYKWFAGFWALVALYEFIVSRLFGLLKKNNRQPPKGALYMNAVVEAAIPTVGLYIISRYMAVSALLTPMSFVYFFFIILSALRLNFMLSAIMGLVAGSGYLYVALLILGERSPPGHLAIMDNIYFQLNKAWLLFVAGLAAGFVGYQIRKRVLDVMEAIQERDQVEKIFGQHVSPEVVQRILDGGMEMESEQRQVCIMFLDIREFTRYAHAQPPETVVTYLNALFDNMITIVNRHHGIINKFLGDGFMAVFGAPFSDDNDCKNAVRAALEITQWVDRPAAEDNIPSTRTGIGIHAGPAVTGHVGSNLRKEYTVIGDTVNLAARLESLNKEYNTRVLVSETVWDAVRDEVRAVAEFGPIRVKGRETPVKVYSLTPNS